MVKNMKIRQITSIVLIITLLGVIFTSTAVADVFPTPVIIAPSSGFAGYAVVVTIHIENPDNHFLFYDIQYGDGTWDRGSIWDGSEELIFTHIWDDPGDFDITAQIADVDTGEMSDIAVHPISIVIGVPAPVLECQRKGAIGEEIEVTLIVDNSLGHHVVYDLQFGDDDFERGDILEPGIVELTFTHMWETSGIYEITAQIGDFTIGVVSETIVHPILIEEPLSFTSKLMKNK